MITIYYLFACPQRTNSIQVCSSNKNKSNRKNSMVDNNGLARSSYIACKTYVIFVLFARM